MSAGMRLRSGMSVRDVCAVLHGWTFRRAGSPDIPPRFHTWDFTSPDETETVRVTFDGTELSAWGAPAIPPASLPRTDSSAALPSPS